MENTEERLRGLIVEYAGVDPEKVTSEAHLFDDLGIDSLEKVELLMAAEDEFRVEIPDSSFDLFKIETVQDMVGLINSRLA